MKRYLFSTILALITLSAIFLTPSCESNEPGKDTPKTDTLVIRDTLVVDSIIVDTLYITDTVASVTPVPLSCVQPPFLQQGDTVAIITPSYFVPLSTLQNACDVIRGWGLVPILGPNTDKQYNGKYAGTVEERAADIHWAWQRPGIKAIITGRGGYGSIQLIDYISPEELSAQPKWLCGFSDISTLHGMLTRAGVMSIHGTMATFLPGSPNTMTTTLMRDLLMGQVPCYNLPPNELNISGKASGILVGGNVCTFAPNVGTWADATLGQDIILFVEEVGESMHNIDRQMRILQLNGVLDRCKGVILGEFADCGNEFKDENGNTMSVEAMLHKMIEPYGIPLICCFPAGHDVVNLPLVMGAPTTMEVSGNNVTVTFNINGEQHIVNTANVSAAPMPRKEIMRLAGKCN